MKSGLKIFAIIFMCLQTAASLANWKSELRNGLWGTVNIIVIDDSKLPVEGATVSIRWGTIGGNERRASGLTDKEGVIQFKGKSSDNCQVSVSKSGYFDSWHEFSFLPPRNAYFKESLEKSARLGRWEGPPKLITLSLQRRFTPFVLPERQLRIDFPSVCHTNVTRSLVEYTNVVSNHMGELAFSLQEVEERHNGKPFKFVLTIGSHDGQKAFIIRNKKKQTDYCFDTLAPERGYTNTLAIAEVDSDARHLRPLINFYEKYVIFRQEIDSGFLFAVIEFCDAYMLREGGFRIKLTYVLFPLKNDGNIQFEKSNQGLPTCASLRKGAE